MQAEAEPALPGAPRRPRTKSGSRGTPQRQQQQEGEEGDKEGESTGTASGDEAGGIVRRSSRRGHRPWPAFSDFAELGDSADDGSSGGSKGESRRLALGGFRSRIGGANDDESSSGTESAEYALSTAAAVARHPPRPAAGFSGDGGGASMQANVAASIRRRGVLGARNLPQEQRVTSDYVGVCWSYRSNKWRAQLNVRGKVRTSLPSGCCPGIRKSALCTCHHGLQQMSRLGSKVVWW